VACKEPDEDIAFGEWCHTASFQREFRTRKRTKELVLVEVFSAFIVYLVSTKQRAEKVIPLLRLGARLAFMMIFNKLI